MIKIFNSQLQNYPSHRFSGYSGYFISTLKLLPFAACSSMLSVWGCRR